ncbi:MAG: hypothetical protein IPO33_18720 [Saprospiraceae bacterium]|nr:hypothetical protein [Candidatus Brachybacter algidus]
MKAYSNCMSEILLIYSPVPGSPDFTIAPNSVKTNPEVITTIENKFEVSFRYYKFRNKLFRHFILYCDV